MPCIKQSGAEVWFECEGECLPIILLHGRGGNSISWWRQLAAFQKNYKVVTLDQRAFGRSKCDAGSFQIQFMVEDILAIMDILKIDRAVLVCQSMSGIIGMKLGLSHPERIAGIVLCSTLGGISTPEMRERLRENEAKNKISLPDRAFAPGYSVREPELYKLYEKILNSNSGFNPDWQKGLSGKGISILPDELEGFSVPTIFIVGSEDMFFPPDMVYQAASYISHASVIELEGLGHSPYWEAPELFNQILSDWLIKHQS